MHLQACWRRGMRAQRSKSLVAGGFQGRNVCHQVQAEWIEIEATRLGKSDDPLAVLVLSSSSSFPPSLFARANKIAFLTSRFLLCWLHCTCACVRSFFQKVSAEWKSFYPAFIRWI
jgi:hypothetical protein